MPIQNPVGNGGSPVTGFVSEGLLSDAARNDMRLVSKFWADDIPVHPENDEINHLLTDVDGDNDPDASFSTVLSMSQKKKFKKSRKNNPNVKQDGITRARAGPRNFT